MYKIGSIPIVLNIKRQMNQTGELFLAAFHIAKTFHTNSQIKIITNNHIFIPNDDASNDNSPAILILEKDSL